MTLAAGFHINDGHTDPGDPSELLAAPTTESIAASRKCDEHVFSLGRSPQLFSWHLSRLATGRGSRELESLSTMSISCAPITTAIPSRQPSATSPPFPRPWFSLAGRGNHRTTLLKRIRQRLTKCFARLPLGSSLSAPQPRATARLWRRHC